jgi:hypothetical protein
VDSDIGLDRYGQTDSFAHQNLVNAYTCCKSMYGSPTSS